MSFIFFILIFILFVGLFIVLALLGLVRSIFNFGRRKNPFQQHEQSAHFEKPHQHTKQKIFDQKEGEYIDFEEIKEEKENK